MAKINQKLITIHEALKTLNTSIELFNKYTTISSSNSTTENKELLLALRDSMIQRFEYCTDLFWKVLKLYLEEIEKIDIPTLSPRGVIRETVKTKTMAENEGTACMEMVEKRNETSHIYHQELAQEIAHKIPEFYKLMVTIADRVQAKSKK